MRVRLVSHVKGLARNNDVVHQEFLDRYNVSKATVKLPGTAQEIHRQVERKRKERKRQEAIASEAIARQGAIKASGTDDYWQRYLPGTTVAATRIIQAWLANYYTDAPSVSPSPESVIAPPRKNKGNLFALLETSGFTLLATLAVKTRYTIREINDHLDAVTKAWPWDGTFERFVQKLAESVCLLPDVDSSLASAWRDASKRVDNERYRRDAALEYVKYYAEYREYQKAVAKMAEQRATALEERAKREAVKRDFVQHTDNTILLWRSGEELRTILRSITNDRH